MFCIKNPKNSNNFFSFNIFMNVNCDFVVEKMNNLRKLLSKFRHSIVLFKYSTKLSG